MAEGGGHGEPLQACGKTGRTRLLEARRLSCGDAGPSGSAFTNNVGPNG